MCRFSFDPGSVYFMLKLFPVGYISGHSCVDLREAVIVGQSIVGKTPQCNYKEEPK